MLSSRNTYFWAFISLNICLHLVENACSFLISYIHVYRFAMLMLRVTIIRSISPFIETLSERIVIAREQIYISVKFKSFTLYSIKHYFIYVRHVNFNVTLNSNKTQSMYHAALGTISQKLLGEAWWKSMRYIFLHICHSSYGITILHTMGCRYNAVNFLECSNNRHPIARPWGSDMRYLLWFLNLIHLLPLLSRCCM